jgi:hypothetical protein
MDNQTECNAHNNKSNDLPFIIKKIEFWTKILILEVFGFRNGP